MYINDVLRRVMNAYPSEYGAAEMYMWCDEVSAMLTQEDRQTYHRAVLPVSADGTFLLPEGVRAEYVTSVSSGNRILDFCDYRMYGHSDIYIRGRQGMRVQNTGIIPTSVTVEYMEPYKPIRAVRYDGPIAEPTISLMSETSEENEVTVFYLNTTAEFIPGDIVTMDITDSGGTYAFDKVYILAASAIDNDGTMSLTTPQVMVYSAQPGAFTFTDEDGTKKAWVPDDDSEAVIRRIVTDKTVCDAPFDTMYVDYLLAMIHTYQHDKVTANDYMTRFNSRLSAYRDWLIKRMPSGDNDIKNWW